MFIIDQQQNLIAAGQDDLARWGYKDIYKAARAFRNGDLRLDPDEGRLISSRTDSSFFCSIETLPSIFGPLNFCMHEEKDKETFENLTLHETPQTADLDEILSIPEKEENKPLSAETGENSEQEAETEIPAGKSISDELSELLPEPLAEEETPAPAADETEESPEKSISDELSELLPEPLAEEETPAPAADEAEESPEKSISDELSELLPEPLAEEETPAPAADEAGLELLPAEDEIQKKPVEKAEEPDFFFPPKEEKHEDLPNLLKEGEESHEILQEKQLPELEEEEEASWQNPVRNFHPDLFSNAEKIELSIAEYSDLLKDFIEDSRKMKNDLLDENLTRRKETVMILKDAVTLLHLDPLNELLDHLEEADQTERETLVREYDHQLDRLEDSLSSLGSGFRESEEAESVSEPEPETEIRERVEKEEQPSEPETEEKSTAEPFSGEETVSTVPEGAAVPAKEEEGGEDTNKFSSDDLLEGVTPIPIEFSIHIAAEELNLPEDLVLEFINDFAKQGHEYLPVLIDAYQNGELEHLQKTAHMLKGAASNLRIEAMVENLYELQFDNDINRAPERIRLFAGQLMSLDKYLQQMSA